jgi:hypothetical protein
MLPLLRSRSQARLMKLQASLGLVACGVTRMFTSWWPRMRAAASTRAELAPSGTMIMLRLGQGPPEMPSRSGSSAVSSACGGRSPTITTARRAWASMAMVSRWRCSVLASTMVEYTRSVWPLAPASSANSSVASGWPWPWRRMTSFCTCLPVAAARPATRRRDESVARSCTAISSGCRCSSCCTMASAGSHTTNSSWRSSDTRRPMSRAAPLAR